MAATWQPRESPLLWGDLCCQWSSRLNLVSTDSAQIVSVKVMHGVGKPLWKLQLHKLSLFGERSILDSNIPEKPQLSFINILFTLPFCISRPGSLFDISQWEATTVTNSQQFTSTDLILEQQQIILFVQRS